MPMVGRGNANRCRLAERESRTPCAQRTFSALPQSVATVVKTNATRLHSDDDKLEILGQYIDWTEGGRRRKECPNNALVAKFGCNRSYPKDLYDLVKKRGTIQNQWMKGNGPQHSEEVWVRMVELIRTKREQRRVASSRFLSNALTSEFGHVSHVAITRAKKRLGFKTVKIVIKPLLNKLLMAERLEFAKKHKRRCFKRTVCIDEKWYTEEKGDSLVVEARDSSPVPNRFKGQQAETQTQRVKVMYLAAVCEGKKIGIYKLEFKEWNLSHTDPVTGKVAKGFGAAFLDHILRRVARDARRILGPGPIAFWQDKAPGHRAKKTQELLESLFEEVFNQPGKSPDTSMLDAGVFPWMEREVDERGCTSKADIHKAVMSVWRTLSPEMLGRVADRVRRNLDNIIHMKGGNFYDEGSDPTCTRANKRARTSARRLR
jgi:hypothetical protein